MAVHDDGADYRVLRTGAELEAIAGQWSELWRSDPHATPFQSPEWLLPWWHHFGDNLRAVAIFQDGALIGLLPFYAYREPVSGSRRLMLLGVGTSDYLDGIFAPACTVAQAGAGLARLWEDESWDWLSVTQLRLCSKLLQAADACGPGRGESCSRMPASPMAGLPQKIRRNAMYYRNRALRKGELCLETASAANLQDTFAALERLHTERWQNRGESGVLADPRVLAWHREALPLLERCGTLRLCTLRLADEIIGVLYSLIDPPWRSSRTQYVYVPGYSTRHAELRPGTLLLALAMEHAAGEGVETIDLLRGDEDYKKLWHPVREATYGFERVRCEEPAMASCLEFAG